MRHAVPAIFLALLCCCDAPPSGTESPRAPGPLPAYPATRRGDRVDDYHGVEVADPYRWLEQLDAAEVADWVRRQNALSIPYLRALPRRDEIQRRLTELWEFERFGVPELRGERCFYSYNAGLADHDVVFVADGLDAPARVLIDPNGFRADGTVALAGLSIAPAGDVVAYAKSDGGSDWRDWFFRRVADGTDLDDRLTWTKFSSPSWARDGSGVWYGRYPLDADGRPDDTRPVSVWFHRLGTDQASDEPVFSADGLPAHRGLRPNASAQATEDGRYLVIELSAGYHENQIHLIDLAAGGPPRPIVGEWRALYDYLGNEGAEFLFSTTDGAPNSRVVAIDVADPTAGWREVIPESADALRSVGYLDGRLVASYLHDASSRIRVFERDGTFVRDVELPGVGTASGFRGEARQSRTFYSFTSFAVPPEVWAYDVGSGESTPFKRPEVGIDTAEFETRQVFYSSKDGTRVPMFVTHRRGLARDGRRPTLLYGYGGFNIALTPRYDTARVVWLEMGGVLAIPNLRGGGEYGKAWHLAGTKLAKQNVFDDFIAAAEWLIAEGYTAPDHLGIQGGSNGGLLVGACMTQRPELFGACLPAVGVLDMLRYHTASANARNWSTDYGLSENADEFAAQLAYSPVHNVRRGTRYPPTLVTTGDHDDRVVPWHSYKLAAALQWAQAGPDPVLIHVETRAGHGAGKPTWMRIEEVADAWAFLAFHLGL